ncbi:MAG: hypothetical protein IKN04_13010, partial [Clostridia bacterium]|nr:hypothetical protein [Clostridia bacterium]
MKKILALLLTMVMALTMVSAIAEDEHVLIYGSSTEISGDFAPTTWWTNNATDAKIRELTNDCTTVVMNKEGEYIVNPTVAESVEGVMNEDGTKTYTIKIKDGLVYNNGDPIGIEDFVWATAFGCTPVIAELGGKATNYQSVVGGQEYYDGTASAISGLRILDDRTMAVSIVAKYVPYYYDILYAQYSAYSMKYWLGDAVSIKDDGEGVYFEGLTKDAVADTIEAARFYAGEDRISTGPYKLIEFDQASKQATLVINENYNGNYEGQKPSVPKIVIVRAEDATWNDALKTGAFNFYDTITDGEQVNQAMDLIEDEENKKALGYGFDFCQFDRPSYGKI